MPATCTNPIVGDWRSSANICNGSSQSSDTSTSLHMDKMRIISQTTVGGDTSSLFLVSAHLGCPGNRLWNGFVCCCCCSIPNTIIMGLIAFIKVTPIGYMYQPFHGRMLPRCCLIVAIYSAQSDQLSVFCPCRPLASILPSRFDKTQRCLSVHAEAQACCRHQETTWTELYLDCISYVTLLPQVNTILADKNLKLTAHHDLDSVDIGEH